MKHFLERIGEAGVACVAHIDERFGVCAILSHHEKDDPSLAVAVGKNGGRDDGVITLGEMLRRGLAALENPIVPLHALPPRVEHAAKVGG